jgi:hypothetical protein
MRVMLLLPQAVKQRDALSVADPITKETGIRITARTRTGFSVKNHAPAQAKACRCHARADDHLSPGKELHVILRQYYLFLKRP